MDVSEIIACIREGQFDRIVEGMEGKNTREVIASISEATSLVLFEKNAQIDHYRKRLRKYMREADETFPAFADGVLSTIKDADKAFNAGTIFNVQWFNDLEFDTDKKISLARQLIDRVSQFNPTYCPRVWHSIAGSDPSVLNSITYENAGDISPDPQTVDEEI